MEGKLTKEKLEELIKEGHTLTEIGDLFDISPSWVSKLAKKWEVKTPPPGHRKGQPLSEKAKMKIIETRNKKGL